MRVGEFGGSARKEGSRLGKLNIKTGGDMATDEFLLHHHLAHAPCIAAKMIR
jgi:hypothetical protein